MNIRLLICSVAAFSVLGSVNEGFAAKTESDSRGVSASDAQYYTGNVPENRTHAEDAKPLLVIRFNQKRVYFGPSLEKAVKAALDVKPTAQFSVVSHVPADMGKRSSARSQDNIQSVMAYLTGMSVPYSTSVVDNAPVEFQEIHIYAH